MTECSVDCRSRFEVFAVSCSGCERLSQSIGLPVACLRAARDVDAAIEDMNRCGHASGALWPGGFQPFKIEDGWRDWRAVTLGRAGPMPRSLHYKNGRFGLDLPSHISVSGFEAALQAEFRRFSLGEVAVTPRWLIAQCDAGRPFLIPPRYTLMDPDDFRADTHRVDDLYVIHPTLHVPQLAQAILRASSIAARAADEVLRHA